MTPVIRAIIIIIMIRNFHIFSTNSCAVCAHVNVHVGINSEDNVISCLKIQNCNQEDKILQKFFDTVVVGLSGLQHRQ